MGFHRIPAAPHCHKLSNIGSIVPFTLGESRRAKEEKAKNPSVH